VDVEVEWTGGDLHGRVGEHIVQCKVTRLASAINLDKRDPGDAITQDQDGRDVIVQCFQLPFTIEDTNECELPGGHAMRHECTEPAMCVNTIGSYECVCPKLGEAGSIDGTVGQEFFANIAQQGRGSWEVSFGLSSESSCPSSASTFGCCTGFAHSNEGKMCRSGFRCATDPCGAGNLNDCDSSALCVRADTPLSKPQYLCQCPRGLMGNGHRCRKGLDAPPKPMLKFDGVTPTEETLKNNYYCGCNQPQIDACEGFPPCEGEFGVNVFFPIFCLIFVQF
jgi:Calcium-binding EGF domain